MIRMIQAGEGSHDVAGVRANAEFRHPPDIDGDLHGDDLITDQAIFFLRYSRGYRRLSATVELVSDVTP